jgi:hypothetical protein
MCSRCYVGDRFEHSLAFGYVLRKLPDRELALWECFEIEASHNTEVVATTFEGAKEVGLCRCVHVRYLSRRKDNLDSESKPCTMAANRLLYILES